MHAVCGYSLLGVVVVLLSVLVAATLPSAALAKDKDGKVDKRLAADIAVGFVRVSVSL